MKFIQSFQQLMGLVLPIIISQLGQVILQITDSVMIGGLGAVSLAASAFASSLFSIFLVLGLAGSTSISTRVAQSHGADRPEDCGEYLRHGIWLGIFFALLFASGLHFLSYRLDWFDQDPGVVAEASVYLRTISWSFLPLAIYQAFRQFCEGLSRPIYPMLIMLGGVFLNIILNWVWIYGNFGFPSLGIKGAGLATLWTRILMLFALVLVVIPSELYQKFKPQNLFSLKFKFIKYKRLLQLGVPSGLQGLFEVGAFASGTIMMGWLGAKSLAAHQIALNLASVTFIIVLSFAFAANIRVGFYFGKRDFVRARQEGLFIILCGACLMGLFAHLIFGFRFILPSFYIKDAEVILIASKLLVIAAIFQVFDGTQAVAIGALRGASDVLGPTLIAFLSYWAIGLPLAYLIGIYLGVGAIGIWAGLAIGLAVAALLLTLRFNSFLRGRST